MFGAMMTHKARIKAKGSKWWLCRTATCFLILGLFWAVFGYSPEPSAEQVNKRREIINNQLSKELNECIAGNIDVIVGLHKCRPFKNHKQAVIWPIKRRM